MYSVSQCISCGSTRLSYFPAFIAPFILARIGATNQGRPQNIRLVKCCQCSMFFFDPRLDEQEMSCLYKDYRGPEYQQLRQQHEPYYTPAFNEAIGRHTLELANRKQNTAAMIQRITPLANIRSVLDFGGDRGQFIPDELAPGAKFVYDISGIEPMPDVTSVSSLKQVADRRFDLVMCSHVLEHVAQPLDVLRSIRELGHENTLFYFEVPFDNPFAPPLAGRSLNAYAWYLIYRSPVILRILQKHVKRGLFCLHEHINLYSKTSLEQMLVQGSFRPLHIQDKIIDLGWTKMRIGCCVCKRREVETNRSISQRQAYRYHSDANIVASPQSHPAQSQKANIRSLETCSGCRSIREIT